MPQETITWNKFPETKPDRSDFFQVALADGTIATAPWLPSWQNFQHGHKDEVLYWAELLTHPTKLL